MSQSEKMLVSNFTLQNGTFITLLILFDLKLSLFCTKIKHFVEYTLRKCFNRFVQSDSEARRQSDENPDISLVAETMKQLANSCSGYQKMDRSRHTVTKCVNDTHCAINRTFSRKLDHMNHQLHELKLPRAEFEDKELFSVGFFILRYPDLLMMEPYYSFFGTFGDINKIDELEMDRNSFFIGLLENEVTDCIEHEMKAEWQKLSIH